MGGIRGGLSFIGSKRIVDSCPTHNPNSQTLYIDANNLVTNTELTTLVSVHLKIIIGSCSSTIVKKPFACHLATLSSPLKKSRKSSVRKSLNAQTTNSPYRQTQCR